MPASLYFANSNIRPRRNVRQAIATSMMIAGLTCTVSAKADYPKTDTQAEIYVGGSYDSNVSVEELGNIINGSDYATIFGGGLDAKLSLTARQKVSASYDFGQTRNTTFKQVNTQTHIAGLQWDMKTGSVDIGTSVHYILARLDNRSFLSSSRFSSFSSAFLSKRWFVRGAYVYNNKDIVDRAERHANAHAGEFDLYFFQRGLRRYFNLGYRFRSENARDSRRDYRSNGVKLRYIQRLTPWSLRAKLELAARYEVRKFRSSSLWFDDTREDERLRLRAELDVELSSRTTLTVYAGYNDYTSDLSVFTYDQTLYGTKISYRWQ